MVNGVDNDGIMVWENSFTFFTNSMRCLLIPNTGSVASRTWHGHLSRKFKPFLTNLVFVVYVQEM